MHCYFQEKSLKIKIHLRCIDPPPKKKMGSHFTAPPDLEKNDEKFSPQNNYTPKV